ncbi:hypothetical protein, partial [Streptomyces chryseus]
MSPAPRPGRSPMPDAVAAVIAAVATENPLAPPEAIGRLAAAALADEGWQVSPDPLCAPLMAESAPYRQKRTPR